MNKKSYLFTSESVSEGHPDKVCDRISDMVVDTYLEKEPFSRVGCETLATRYSFILYYFILFYFFLITKERENEKELFIYQRVCFRRTSR